MHICKPRGHTSAALGSNPCAQLIKSQNQNFCRRAHVNLLLDSVICCFVLSVISVCSLCHLFLCWLVLSAAWFCLLSDSFCCLVLSAVRFLLLTSSVWYQALSAFWFSLQPYFLCLLVSTSFRVVQLPDSVCPVCCGVLSLVLFYRQRFAACLCCLALSASFSTFSFWVLFVWFDLVGLFCAYR